MTKDLKIELERLQAFVGDVEPGCDIQKAHALYRQVPVVICPGNTADQIRADAAESALAAMRTKYLDACQEIVRLMVLAGESGMRAEAAEKSLALLEAHPVALAQAPL